MTGPVAGVVAARALGACVAGRLHRGRRPREAAVARHPRRGIAAFLALGLVVGCTKAPAAPAVSDCASTAPGVFTVAATLEDGRAEPAPHRVPVALGRTVRVQVTSDKVVQVHIHGYDLEYDAAPGTPGCVAFTPDRAGLFDVEAHPDTLLLQLEVR